MKRLIFILSLLTFITSAAQAQQGNFVNKSGSSNITASINLAVTTGAITIAPFNTQSAIEAGLEKTAEFLVTGEGTSGFSISIPTGDISLTGPGTAMTVGTFVCDAGTSSSLSLGTKVLLVKATLNVGANQVAGTYTNASDLFVTVNYN